VWDLCWISLSLKDCTTWKGPILKQFVKNCSLREGLMLEKFMGDSILWEGPNAGGGEEREEGGVADMKRYELTATPFSIHLHCTGRGGDIRAGSDVEPGKKEM